MKEKTVNRLTRAVRSLFGALLGDGVKRPTEHVRQVHGVRIPDVPNVNC